MTKSTRKLNMKYAKPETLNTKPLLIILKDCEADLVGSASMDLPAIKWGALAFRV